MTAVLACLLAGAGAGLCARICLLVLRDGRAPATYVPAHAAPRTLPLQLPALVTDIYGALLPGTHITDSGLMPAITAGEH